MPRITRPLYNAFESERLQFTMQYKALYTLAASGYLFAEVRATGRMGDTLQVSQDAGATWADVSHGTAIQVKPGTVLYAEDGKCIVTVDLYRSAGFQDSAGESAYVAAVDPDTGAIVDANGAKRSVIGTLTPRAHMSKVWRSTLVTVPNAINRTDHIQTVLECPPALVRIGIINGLGVAISGLQVAIASALYLGGATESASIDPTAAGGVWVPSLQGGLAAWTAAAGYTGNKDPRVTFGDWTEYPNASQNTEEPSGLTPIHVRVQTPASVANLSVLAAADTAGWEDAINVGGRVYRARVQQTILGVTTKSAFTSVVHNGQVLPIVIQYVPRSNVRGFTAAVCGDRVNAGAGATVHGYGWLERAQRLVSTPQQPFEIANLAIA